MYKLVQLAVVLLCGFGVTSTANAATLSVSPSTGVYEVGGTFTARVVVNTQGETINAAEGTLQFDPAELTVRSVRKGSVFNLWTSDPSYSNSAGTVSFSGGVTPPGFSGGAGTVISVTFQTKVAGAPRVTMSDGAVLAADGRGTNVLSNMGNASYTVTAPSTSPEPEVVEYVPVANTPGRPDISATIHPADGWSAATVAELSWTLPADVTAVRTLLNNSPSAVPSKVYEPPIQTITLEDLAEGEQYFHLQFQNSDGWGAVAHYPLRVDTTDPTSFSIGLPENADLSNPEQTLTLTASDTPSGIRSYEVQLDGGEPFTFTPDTASSTLTLPPLEPGKHTVVIEAFDAAGNGLVDTFSFTITAFDRPQFTDVPQRVNEGVVPVFTGQTRPQASVTVMLHPQGADTKEVTVQADADGVFTYIPDAPLAAGVYDLTAQAVDQYGAISEESERVRFIVEQPGYIAVGSMMISVMSVVVPLVALSVLLVLGGVYAWRRLRLVGRTVRRETGEALTVVEESFADLRSTLQQEADALAATRKSKKLTKAETALVAAMTDQLTAAETAITDEVSDVDDIVE